MVVSDGCWGALPVASYTEENRTFWRSGTSCSLYLVALDEADQDEHLNSAHCSSVAVLRVPLRILSPVVTREYGQSHCRVCTLIAVLSEDPKSEDVYSFAFPPGSPASGFLKLLLMSALYYYLG